MTKNQQVQKYLADSNLKGALRIASKFRLAFSKEQQKTLQIAHECLCGKADFYRQLGINTREVTMAAETLLNNVYLKSNGVTAETSIRY